MRLSVGSLVFLKSTLGVQHEQVAMAIEAHPRDRSWSFYIFETAAVVVIPREAISEKVRLQPDWWEEFADHPKRVYGERGTKPAEQRSTPEHIAQGTRLRALDGTVWVYSIFRDIWSAETAPDTVRTSSALSWHRLLADYGPLEEL